MQTLSRILSTSLLAASVILALPGCEFLHRNTIGLFDAPILTTETQPNSFSSSSPITQAEESLSTTTVEIEKLPEPSKDKDNSQIEIVWEIPKEPVDGFLIHYGFSEDSLENVIRLRTSEIEKYDDPQHGFVYRYKLEGVPAERDVFVALATFQGEATSELSAVFPVGSSKKKGGRGAR